MTDTTNTTTTTTTTTTTSESVCNKVTGSLKRDKSNPWGAPPPPPPPLPSTTTTNNNNNNNHASKEASNKSLAAIMQQQELESTSAVKNDDKNRRAEESEEEEDQMIRLAIEASLQESTTTAAAAYQPQEDSVAVGGGGGSVEEEMDDDMKLALALSLQEQEQQQSQTCTASSSATSTTTAAASSSSATSSTTTTNTTNTTNNNSHITKEEEILIQRALAEADEAETRASLDLALHLQQQEQEQAQAEAELASSYHNKRKQEGNVRIVHRHDFEWHNHHRTDEEKKKAASFTKPERKLYGQHDVYEEDDDDYYESEEEEEEEYQEYRMNAQPKSKYNTASSSSSSSSTPQKNNTESQWSRYDKNTIIGPNNEIRTKHDVSLKHRSNASRLLSTSSRSTTDHYSVNDRAYNSFLQKQKRFVTKGVATHGHGRAENMSEKTRGGAMDTNVRLIISKVINNGMIEVCNGVVKEGKEAIVYHAAAAGGETTKREEKEKEEEKEEEKKKKKNTNRYDVAIKVFKRITEFKTRGKYVDGDPRYHDCKFSRENKRDQVEIWAEKEYRNLLRANKAGVPVPTPLLQRENVLFMRFLGEDGWPSPQLREIDNATIKRGSKKWTNLYCQVLCAVRRLYHCARLVHGDLSEYNILICPSMLVENSVYSRRRANNNTILETSTKKEEEEEDANSLQIVLIDFGQAVERGHPGSRELLRRDLSMVKAFFKRQGILTLAEDEAEEFIVDECEGDEEEEEEEDVDGGDDDDEDDDDIAIGWETVDNCGSAQLPPSDAVGKSKEGVLDNEEKKKEGAAAQTHDMFTKPSSDSPTSILDATQPVASASSLSLEKIKSESTSHEEDTNKKDDDDDGGENKMFVSKSSWRHSVQKWDDDRDFDVLKEMLRAKKNKKIG